ncbi:hypothetical protein AAG570_002214 [Ranatra chinensis]|uniref:Uncharacterized protein n=1 Tax=Ranatra chinensis TaxID=642074 RepID=A0ABD0Y7E0_9HEMI
MPADAELTTILDRRQAINDALDKGDQVEHQFRARRSVYAEFTEFTRKQIKEYENTFNRSASKLYRLPKLKSLSYKTALLYIKPCIRTLGQRPVHIMTSLIPKSQILIRSNPPDSKHSALGRFKSGLDSFGGNAEVVMYGLIGNIPEGIENGTEDF